jgi:hypothetical protein
MHGELGLAFALGLILSTACGGDGANGDKTSDQGPSTAGGACGQGKYPGGTGTLTLCGPDAMDTACMPIEKFRGYTEYGGDIDVFGGSLPDLSTISCLKSVGKLTLSGCDAITDLSGLENLVSASALEVIGNEKLASLEGIDRLAQVVQITINDNDGLTDIVGLPEGFSAGSLYVEINRNLTSLDGLKGVKVSKKLGIEGNRALSKCKVDTFAAGFPGVALVNRDNLEETCP